MNAIEDAVNGVEKAVNGVMAFGTIIMHIVVWTEQTRLIRCLLYGFVDYSSFEKVIES